MARPSKQVIRLRNMVRRMRLAVGYLYSDDRPCRVINHNTGKDLFVKQEDIRAMPKVAYKWGVFIAVLCKNEFGDRYMKADYIKVDRPITQPELADFLNEQHSELIKNTNPKHLVDVGWLASPTGKEWTEEQAFEIFERMAA